MGHDRYLPLVTIMAIVPLRSVSMPNHPAYRSKKFRICPALSSSPPEKNARLIPFPKPYVGIMQHHQLTLHSLNYSFEMPRMSFQKSRTRIIFQRHLTPF
jgi:hypothetical protein